MKAGGDLTQEDLSAALCFFWHPVCTLEELAAAPRDVLGVTLLGRELVVAALGGGAVACLLDRCLHRSTRLSIGWVDEGAIRCAYHGWRWAADGRCVEIPAAPGLPIPGRACQEAFAAEVRHGLIWVCLDDRAGSRIPDCPALADTTMRVVAGTPYTWPTSAPRRVENFVDLAHFAWVHDGSLGRRDDPVPPLPAVHRRSGELRFEFIPPPLPDTATTALLGASRYRIPLPCTVNIEFDIDGQPGVRRHLWMTASPVGPGVSRTFWLVARNDRHDDSDQEFLDFQYQILAEDEPVVCNQRPAEFPLHGSEEVSVRADRVSVEYRRWMTELVVAARRGPDQLAHALGARDLGARDLGARDLGARDLGARDLGARDLARLDQP